MSRIASRLSVEREYASAPHGRQWPDERARVDYEHRYDTTNRTLSHTFGNPVQDRLVVDGLLWLGSGAKTAAAK